MDPLWKLLWARNWLHLHLLPASCITWTINKFGSGLRDYPSLHSTYGLSIWQYLNILLAPNSPPILSPLTHLPVHLRMHRNEIASSFHPISQQLMFSGYHKSSNEWTRHFSTFRTMWLVGIWGQFFILGSGHGRDAGALVIWSSRLEPNTYLVLDLYNFSFAGFEDASWFAIKPQFTVTYLFHPSCRK